MMIEKYIIPENLSFSRLDKALTNLKQIFSRNQIQQIIHNEQVKVNNIIIKSPKFLVKSADEITVCYIKKDFDTKLLKLNIELDIIYEDKELAVINKPAGLTVHPGHGNENNTLVNALLYHMDSLSTIGDTNRPGIVHRLDKDTSGLMVIAKSNLAYLDLVEQIKKRILVRRYKALIWGIMNPTSGSIKNNIGRNKIHREKMSILKNGGKEAITNYKTDTILYNGLISILDCTLQTGRTHQIRVQLSHLQHSVVGDKCYGHHNRKLKNTSLVLQQKISQLSRQALHSWYISFIHPVDKKILSFKSSLPTDILKIIS